MRGAAPDHVGRRCGSDLRSADVDGGTCWSRTRANASKIASTLKSLDPAGRKVVQSAFISCLGRAAPGQQEASGEVFSSERFLSVWSRIDPRSKAVLFSDQDGQLRAELDKVAKVAHQVRKGSAVFSNPSGTSGGVGPWRR